MHSLLPAWVLDLSPIVILLAVIALVVTRLPKIDLGHSPQFLRRRFANWFPLGMTYAFLYMGRYNLAVCKNALGAAISNEDFGNIKAAGTLVYGLAFVLNGPLTDRFGGRFTILVAAAGAALMNTLMGASLLSPDHSHLVRTFMVLYALNMYFQSFGAVSIVKVNTAWFHLRERGSFGGIFGILISLGIYFAFDWGHRITRALPVHWVFFIPAIILAFWFVLDFFLVYDTPAAAGLTDIETGDADWSHLPAAPGFLKRLAQVAVAMLRQPIVVTIALVELCTGFLRAALMDWYYLFAQQTGILESSFVPRNWGMVQCVAGILGGVAAGYLSDRLFQSRRGPVAVWLYGITLTGTIAMSILLTTSALGLVCFVMMLALIGTHGVLSGAASMDFGGKQNVGVAVGMIDGLVYLGQGAQAIVLGHLLPQVATVAKDPHSWAIWPIVMAPVALVGLVLSSRIWNARPAAAKS